MDKREARRQFRQKVAVAMRPFGEGVTYGMGIYVPEVIKAIIDAAEEFHKQMSEIDG